MKNLKKNMERSNNTIEAYTARKACYCGSKCSCTCPWIFGLIYSTKSNNAMLTDETIKRSTFAV